MSKYPIFLFKFSIGCNFLSYANKTCINISRKYLSYQEYSILKKGEMQYTSLIKELKEFASLHLAESWDNVGVLVEPPNMRTISKLLLTNDLTLAVMDEAEEKHVDMILTYHPLIFEPLKRITTSHWKQLIVGRCIAKKIAVYSPHTSYDALKGGVNDWLISAFGPGSVKPITTSLHSGSWTHKIEILKQCQLFDRCHSINETFKDEAEVISADDKRSIISVFCKENILVDIISFLSKADSEAKFAVSKLNNVPMADFGMGRICTLNTPLTLKEAILAVKVHLGLSHLRVAVRYGGNQGDLIRSVAVCAGSGGSLLKNVMVDLCVSGEMSHHQVLEMTHKGINVILVDHSNSERGFLSAVLKPRLSSKFNSSVEVIVSTADADPLTIV